MKSYHIALYAGAAMLFAGAASAEEHGAKQRTQTDAGYGVEQTQANVDAARDQRGTEAAGYGVDGPAYPAGVVPRETLEARQAEQQDMERQDQAQPFPGQTGQAQQQGQAGEAAQTWQGDDARQQAEQDRDQRQQARIEDHPAMVDRAEDFDREARREQLAELGVDINEAAPARILDPGTIGEDQAALREFEFEQGSTEF